MALLTETEILERLARVPGWERRGQEIRRTWAFADFRGAMAFVNRVAASRGGGGPPPRHRHPLLEGDPRPEHARRGRASPRATSPSPRRSGRESDRRRLGRPARARARGRSSAGEVAWAGDRAEIDVDRRRGGGAPSSRASGPTSSSTPPPATAWTRPRPSPPPRSPSTRRPRTSSPARRARTRAPSWCTTRPTTSSTGRPRGRTGRTTPRALSGSTAPRSSRGSISWPRAGGEHLVVRTSGVLGRGGSEQKGGSFVERIVAQARAGQPLRVVADQVFAPTCAADLATASLALVRAGGAGRSST